MSVALLQSSFDEAIARNFLEPLSPEEVAQLGAIWDKLLAASRAFPLNKHTGSRTAERSTAFSPAVPSHASGGLIERSTTRATPSFRTAASRSSAPTAPAGMMIWAPVLCAADLTRSRRAASAKAPIEIAIRSAPALT